MRILTNFTCILLLFCNSLLSARQRPSHLQKQSLPVTRTAHLIMQSLPVQNQGSRYNLIPYPALLVPASGSFTISRNTLVRTDSRFLPEKAFFLRLLNAYLGSGGYRNHFSTANSIRLKFDASIPTAEGYKLLIRPDGIILSARGNAGMFYGMETLRQLMPAGVENERGETLTLPAVRIEDKPAFVWRGMMLDVSRHFFSIDYLHKYVDRMALYKLNKLHLHLTDDQGWRLEIKKYPQLTSRGAWRELNDQDSSCIQLAKVTGNKDFVIDKSHFIRRNGKTLYGGFYTQREMRDFIRYAASRHIEVIPEIDMPGHMMAAVRLFPFLTCDSTMGGGTGFSVPICPASPQVMNFARDIFAEVSALFPSRYIHIGGDEVDVKNWIDAPASKAFMQARGFTTPAQLQSYFNEEMMKFFHSKGKTLLGWDEITEGRLDSSATVMFWRPWAPNAPLVATRNHNNLIMTPDGPFYFDAFPDANTLKAVYNYNPLDTMYHLNGEEQSRILGVQANLWTERVPTETRADYLTMPSLQALAERGWTNRPAYADFLMRLNRQYERLDRLGVSYRLPDIAGLVEQNAFVGKTSFFRASPSDYFKLHYTIDGSAPAVKSPVMDKPLLIDRTLVLKLALFTPSGRAGDISTLHFNAQQYSQAIPASLSGLKDGLDAELTKGSFKLTTQISGKPDSLFTVSGIQVPSTITAPEFGLKFHGLIEVPEDGIYSFYLNCNDGGVLHLAGKVVVDNDGLHSDKEKGGQIALLKGLHVIAVEFMEAGGGYKLELKYSLNGSTPTPIPASWYRSVK